MTKGSERFLCIHGHFYQPPRENPWLGVIETQDTAYPYHDWNDRITDECYAPNAFARILDGEKRIAEIVNNYARMSFNFGPTLLSWMEENRPGTYRAVLDADQESRNRFSGHGSACAQAYNHMILPLANARDKVTQVLWGIADFQHRFRRKPEGMWLPETAVDTDTLEVLAENDIKFTVLSPHQASRVRKIGEEKWRDVTGERINPKRAYLCNLPSGRSISLFFYDGPVSRAVAFEGILTNGEIFANRVTGILLDDHDGAQLAHIASDGETYGHHHHYGDMALAYALRHVEESKIARITNYAEFLALHPPTREVEIVEKSSWSCAHGVERWRSDCGCTTRGHAGWNQAWRGPLREALDWLRDSVAPVYEEKASALFPDPWVARNAYIRVVLNRSPENVSAFLAEHTGRTLNDHERLLALKFLELQHNAMLMYTSCGWFFSDVSDIEPVQLMMYASRVAQLAQEVSGQNFEEPFVERLSLAQGNVAPLPNGAAVYEAFVRPAEVDLLKVGGHFAVSSLFEDHPEPAGIYAYTVDECKKSVRESGNMKLLLGCARVTSEIITESKKVTFGVVHLGDHNLNGGVREFAGEAEYKTMVKEVTEAFRRADIPAVIRLFDRHFGTSTYTLQSLFREEQRRVTGQILQSILAEAQEVQRRFYRDHEPLMRFLRSIGAPVPSVFLSSAAFVLNADLRTAFEEDFVDPEEIDKLLQDAQYLGVSLDAAGLSFTAREALERLMANFRARPEDEVLLKKLSRCAELTRNLPFSVNLWKIQNHYYEMMHGPDAAHHAKRAAEEEASRRWLRSFHSLGRALYVAVPET